MLTRRQAVAGAAAATLAAGNASALTLDRVAHMIVGFAAGGGTDVSARIFAEKLGGVYAPAVIVDNKVGVAGRLAVENLRDAPPDGSVMLFTPDFPIVLYPSLYKNLSYDPLRDLIPVAPLTKSALVLSVGPAVPNDVVDVPGFVAWCKAHPDKAAYATTGPGGTPHLVGVMLSKTSGTPMLAVHYRGGAPALQDVVGGQVPASVNPSSEAIPLAKGGLIRILGAAGSNRSRFLPDIRTMREQGFDIALDTWTGVLLPAKTPNAVVGALADALEKAVTSPAMIEAQSNLGNETTFQPRARFAETVKADIERWRPIVAASGFVPED